ncbi:hypothetical protein VCV18_007127 [Metarhizium anisopliae]
MEHLNQALACRPHHNHHIWAIQAPASPFSALLAWYCSLPRTPFDVDGVSGVADYQDRGWLRETTRYTLATFAHHASLNEMWRDAEWCHPRNQRKISDCIGRWDQFE